MNLVTVLECQSLGFIHYMYGGHEPFRFFFSLSAYTRFRMKHMDFDLGKHNLRTKSESSLPIYFGVGVGVGVGVGISFVGTALL
jgi:hypothetical protein